MPALLDGPRLAPRSGGPARQLVVLIHGYGADGHDLIGMGEAWQHLLPDAAFVAPDAPEWCDASQIGRQWFPLSVRDMRERWSGVTAAGPGLEAFFEAELARHGLPPEALAIVGFSQGTMMALYAGLRRAAAPAAIVGYSGVLAVPPSGGVAAMAGEIRVRPPVLLLHGDEDEVIPPRALSQAAEGLKALGIPVEWHLSHGIGHAIDPEGLQHGGEFLARRFGIPFGHEA